METNSDEISHFLCGKNDLKDEEMRLFEITINDETFKIILVKTEGNFYATGSLCTHYKLSLKDGCYYKGRLRCYAHGACFNVKTGDIEDYPGIDSLPTYKVEIEEDKVFLKASVDSLRQENRVKVSKAKRPTSAKSETCIIIGSGAAGLMCVEALREEGYNGHVVMLTTDRHYPYYRPKLSKILDIPITHPLMTLRNADFFSKHNIDFKPNTEVSHINFDKKIIQTSIGAFSYDKLVIATGLKAINPLNEISTTPLKGVFTIRSLDEANQIAEYVKELKASVTTPLQVAVIGGSFMAMESATYFPQHGNITVYCRRKPCLMPFGPQVAEQVGLLHKRKNINIVIDTLEVKELQSHSEDSTRLGSICFANQETSRSVKADICIFAIGSTVATEFLEKTSGLKRTANNYIEVDEYMRTNISDVYAAGDLTSFPFKCLMGLTHVQDSFKSEQINLQHWQMASTQGKTAGYHITGRLDKPLRVVPFFWSQKFSNILRYAGYCEQYDEIVFHNLSENTDSVKFVAFYVIKDYVVAICSCNMDPITSIAAELFLNNEKITKESVINDPWGFKGRVYFNR